MQEILDIINSVLLADSDLNLGEPLTLDEEMLLTSMDLFNLMNV